MTPKTYAIIGVVVLTATLLPANVEQVFAPSRDLTEEERESGRWL